MFKSFLQTKEWLDFQKYIGNKTWRFPSTSSGQVDSGAIVANIIQHKIPFGKNYLYIPHGPEISFDNIQSGLKNEVNNFLSYLKKLGKENRSIFVKIEPLADVVVELVFRKGIKISKKHIQPQRTVIINLELSEEELFSRMHHKTRYNIHLAEKKGLQFEESTDLDVFWRLLQNTAKKDKFYTHTKDYYEKLIKFFSSTDSTHSTKLQGGTSSEPQSNSESVESTSSRQASSEQANELRTKLFFVLYNGKHIAGAITMSYGDTVYYLHGAMDRGHKELMAPYFMHWEIIKFFKAASGQQPVTGYKYYDLWGIDAQKWPGVTRFKLGWGGNTKEYSGSLDLPISKFWYLVYKAARRVF